MSIAIKIENLSKIYHLGQIGTGTFYKDFQRFTAKIRGKEDPFLKIGETNDRSTKGGDVVYSLKDINLEIKQGDAVGIIGKNGAGKSTLLKIISQITAPTTGQIKIKGRVASLLEVGTGFHPELTGRENIYLNGAILGMRKVEITRKMDEIVDFSGVERYIDTPVKRYSSGMYVRLAFAVAAHLESEILIVDEVLAVGDAEFQKKCLGKMGDISKGEGRTVLFVSHNIDTVSRLCDYGLLLKNGNLILEGDINKIVSSYINENSLAKSYYKPEDNIVKELSAHYSDNCLKLELKLESNFTIKNPNLGFVVSSEIGEPLFGTNMYQSGYSENLLSINKASINVEILSPILSIGKYFISIWFEDGNSGLSHFFVMENCLSFEVENTNQLFDSHNSKIEGWILPRCKWQIK